MSQYIPRGGSLRAVKHERGPNDSADYWMVYDDYGPYDGPWATEADALAYIHDQLAPLWRG